MSMDNDERILIGIINSRNYTTKNNQDCSNIDIGFEEFCSNDKNNTREYGVVNQVRFLDEEPKVFLTCEAAATRNKFGEGHLIRIKANPSPEDKGCRYTTYNKNISKVDVDDFIEIINPKIESWHAAERVAVLEHRPSTDYVMAECNKYVVSQEVFPFLSCDSVEFYSLEKAKKFLLEQFEREFGEVKKTPSIEFADDFKAVTRDLNEKFYNYVLKKTKDRLNAFDLKSLAEKGNIGYLNTIIAESINSFAADNNLVRDTAEKIRNNILADGTMQEILQALIEADKAKEDTEGQKTAVTGENSASAVNPAEENVVKQADNENTGNAEVSAGSVASDVSQTSAVQSDNGGQSVSSEQEKQTGSFSSVEENADGIKVIRSTANDIIKMGSRPFTIGDEEERSNRAMVLRAVASMSGGLGSSPDSDSFSSLSKAISKASSMDDGILEEEEEYWNADTLRQATETEKQNLLRELAKSGKRWNEKEKEFEPCEPYEVIRTFEDAVQATGMTFPIDERTMSLLGADVVAYMKLRVIVAAINGLSETTLDQFPRFTTDEYRYYPWFYLYTQEEIDAMSEEDRQRVVGRANNNAFAGGGCVCADAYGASSDSFTSSGARLAFKTRKSAEYAGRQFVEEWADFYFKPRSEDAAQ